MPHEDPAHDDRTTLTDQQIALMFEAAQHARDNAYAPYSAFHVGAAVLDDQGRIFAGCNVENASFGGTICAERNAVAAAVVAGARRLIGCVVIVQTARPASPCGLCRQVLSEFGPTMPVICFGAQGDRITTSMTDLLPMAFEPSQLSEERVPTCSHGGLDE